MRLPAILPAMFWIEVVLMVFPLVVLRVAKLRTTSYVVPVGAERAAGLRDVASDPFAGGIQPGGGYHYFPNLGRIVDLLVLWLEICAYIVLIRLPLILL